MKLKEGGSHIEGNEVQVGSAEGVVTTWWRNQKGMLTTGGLSCAISVFNNFFEESFSVEFLKCVFELLILFFRC
jgi:hypothetical protein